ncbi:hypothetical protein H5410_008631 [Solanum commersonii]|uniref:Retrotransposon gag domain-containing protein n=1 Tax=Solanum commersonii TaxID=4109 RepID=A0A9J6AFI0_SOLCO|nr:hypothetical protein H5410_008631 [Solanum commersonii]
MATEEALDAVKKNDKGKNHEETEGAGEIYTPSGQPMAWVSASQTGGAPTMVTPGGYQLGMRHLPQFQSPLGGSMHHTPVMGGGPAGHMGAGSSTPFQMHTGGQTQMPYGGFQSHPTMGIPGGEGTQPPAHGHFFNSMSRLSKIEFPRSYGESKLVKQTGSVKDYQNEFDKIMTRLTILPEYAISGFITGLKPEIGYTVKNHKPFSLPQAYPAETPEARLMPNKIG